MFMNVLPVLLPFLQKQQNYKSEGIFIFHVSHSTEKLIHIFYITLRPIGYFYPFALVCTNKM